MASEMPYPVGLGYRMDAIEERIKRIESEGLARALAAMAQDVAVMRTQQTAAAQLLTSWQEGQDRRLLAIEAIQRADNARIDSLESFRDTQRATAAERGLSEGQRRWLVGTMLGALSLLVAILAVLVGQL